MKQQKTRIISFMLVLVIALEVICPATAMKTYAAENTTSYEKQLNAVTEYLKKNVEKPGIGSEWVVLAAARSGMEDPDWYRAYFDSVSDAAKQSTDSKLGKFTDNAKAVIALSAIGADSERVSQNNLLYPLFDFEGIKGQYVTCAIYVLIAFDAKHDYMIPKTPSATSTGKLVEYILSNFDKEKGFIGYEWEGVAYADLDSTAMALQALTPYYNTDKNVKSVVDKALEYLSTIQNGDGSYGGNYDDKVCSTAQVLCALSCYGIDTEKDNRFMKNGNSALDALLSYAKPDGSIVMEGANVPMMDCEQAAYALVAYDRMKKGKNSLYDMSDAVVMFAKAPAKTAIKKVTSPAKRQLNVSWKKKSGINGYELEVSSSADFKKKNTRKFNLTKKQTSKLIKKSVLKSKKKAYVRVRTYKNVTVNGVKYKVNSSWSAVKKLKIK